ncbi:MAG: hypothetical protein L6Q47_04200 [Ignavibacteriaceae bacterium]|nr:hypothetical protein [Ignavibacteriaceae bacterium]
MNELRDAALDITGSWPWLIFLLLLLGIYAWFSYRFTLPVVSKAKRYLLLCIRAVVVLLILFLMFEPVLSLFYETRLQPVHYVAIDRSASLGSGKDSADKATLMKDITGQFSSKSGDVNFRYILFDGQAEFAENEQLAALTYTGNATDMEAVINAIPDDVPAASLTIISDGIINKGGNPLTRADRLGYPVYTIGAGDTSRKKDVSIRSIIHNETVYAGTETKINVTVSSFGFSGEALTVSLYEDNKLISSEIVTLTTDGITSVLFSYKPSAPGEKKITAEVTAPKGDEQPGNNKKVAYINVLTDKLKVHLIAGFPSSDVSFIRAALQTDTSLKVTSLIQIAQGKFLEGNYSKADAEKADILFLINFPAAETSPQMLEDIRSILAGKNTPFYILLPPFTDAQKLRVLAPYLPFDVIMAQNGGNKEGILPNLNEAFKLHPVIRAGAGSVPGSINGLPPIVQPGWVLRNKAGALPLITIRQNNVTLDDPMLTAMSLGKLRVIAFNGANLWRWKLNTNEAFDFDNFIIGIARWLASAEERKLLTVKPVKKLFSENEAVEISAELLDESRNALEGEEITLTLSSQNVQREYIMNELGRGLYEIVTDQLPPGDYKYKGSVTRNGRLYAADSGRINIGEIDFERSNLTADANFLAALAFYSGGKYFHGSNFTGIFNEYSRLDQKKAPFKSTVDEHRIWSNIYILICIILLLSAEWFMRKRAGML